MARDRKRHVSKKAGPDAPDADAASAPPVHVLATAATAGLVTRPISHAEREMLIEQYLHFIRILAREAARSDHQSAATGNTSHRGIATKLGGPKRRR
ncbi:hypothetical protein U713_04015 [Rhodobacter capsulatus YW2]|nr:hypothetical protein U713_04015 [Rhodobacter capsulatus YW2]